MTTGLANTPLINYFFYKQSTFVSSDPDGCCFPILSIADGGNGQLLITTDDTSKLSAGVALTISGTTSYDGDYTCISVTPSTFNVSGIFGASETGTWELNSTQTGAQTGDPLDFGTIEFYDNADKITPLNTYQDRALTVLNPNPLILDALGSAPPIYLLDQPYYIVIKDKFNNLVATLDNYLPQGDESIPTSALPLDNLFPNYGFDTRIDEDISGEVVIPANTAQAVSAGWFWEIDTTEPSPQNTYTYAALGASSLEGNPKNELQLKSTNNTTGQTINRLYCVLGDYNSLQEQQLAVAIYTRLISGAPQTLPCELIRIKNGVAETPISVGSINIDTTRTQESIVFTVPALTTSDYANDDELRFAINLPLNEDFEHGYTGTWAQLSPDGLFSVSENASSVDAAKEYFGLSFRQLQANNQFNFTDLPVGIGGGRATVLNETGRIFLAPIGSSFNFAKSMVIQGLDDPGFELVNNERLNNTQTDRLIALLRARNLTQSRHTFNANNAANVVTVTSGIGASPNSTWQTSAGPQLVVAQTTPEFATYRLAAVPLGNGVIRFTFQDMFDAFVSPFNPQYSFGGGDLLNDINSRQNVLVSYLGNLDFQTFNANKNLFYPAHSWSIQNNGSPTESAEVTYTFDDVSRSDNMLTDKRLAGNPPGTVLVAINETNSYYQGFSGFREYDAAGGLQQASQVTGYLGYNDAGPPAGPQTFPPPRVIRFTVNGVTNAPTGSVSTATIPLTLFDTKEQVCQKLSEVLNESAVHTITVVSAPTNGDIIEISNDQTDFNLIMYDTAQPKPVNPSAVRKPIYVPFTQAQTTTQIAESIVTVLEYGVMGIPRAADLGLPFYTGLEWFMVV